MDTHIERRTVTDQTRDKSRFRSYPQKVLCFKVDVTTTAVNVYEWLRIVILEMILKTTEIPADPQTVFLWACLTYNSVADFTFCN